MSWLSTVANLLLYQAGWIHCLEACHEYIGKLGPQQFDQFVMCIVFSQKSLKVLIAVLCVLWHVGLWWLPLSQCLLCSCLWIPGMSCWRGWKNFAIERIALKTLVQECMLFCSPAVCTCYSITFTVHVSGTIFAQGSICWDVEKDSLLSEACGYNGKFSSCSSFSGWGGMLHCFQSI